MTPRSAGVARQTQDGSERNQLFMKTKLCKFEMRGMCMKGPSCCFAHSRGELRELPDLRCTKLCAAFAKGECDKTDCTFAHAKAELRTTGKFFRTKREQLHKTPAMDLSWTPQLSSEDETGGSEVSLDVSCPSSGLDAPDFVTMFGPFWGTPTSEHLDPCGFGYTMMEAFAPGPSGGLSPIGHGTLAGEPAYVPLRSTSRASSLLMDSWDGTYPPDSIDVHPNDDTWKVQGAAQSLFYN